MENFFSVLRNASKAVPFLKYAIGLSGIAALLALVKSYGLDYEVAIWGSVIALILMIILFLLSKAYHSSRRSFHKPAYFLICSITYLFVLTALLLLSCAFFDLPKPIMQVLHPSKFENILKPELNPDVSQTELIDFEITSVSSGSINKPQAIPSTGNYNSSNKATIILQDNSQIGTLINGDSNTIHITQNF